MEKIANKYIENYYSKYDKEHRIWINEVPMVKEAITTLLPEKNIVKFIRNFSGNNGFMFSEAQEISIIQDLWSHHSHSGASATCCLRICQFIFTQMFDENIDLIV